MANGEQIELCIQEAKERIAAQGYANCDTGTMMLAGFGYLADKMANRPLLGGKKLTGVAAGIGTLLGAVVMQIAG
jgi:hypothetical protein